MNVGLITAVYDHYDTLKPFPHQEGVEVDAVCVTDDPWLSCEGWRIVVEPRPGMHPNRAAKVPKMLPWRYVRAPSSVWVDASFRIVSPAFVAEAVAYADPIAQFVHPWRDCAYEEATESLRLAKYAGEPIKSQMEAVRREGHPEHWGLWATGIIARVHDPAVKLFGVSWLSACMTWSYQDQLSEAPALRRCGLIPVALPGTHMDNDWLAYEGSARH